MWALVPQLDPGRALFLDSFRAFPTWNQAVLQSSKSKVRIRLQAVSRPPVRVRVVLGERKFSVRTTFVTYDECKRTRSKQAEHDSRVRKHRPSSKYLSLLNECVTAGPAYLEPLCCRLYFRPLGMVGGQKPPTNNHRPIDRSMGAGDSYTDFTPISSGRICTT